MNDRAINDMLPIEIQVKIFSYLDGASLSVASQVCKHWKHLCECEPLWKSKSMQIDDTDALKYILTSRSEGHSWKESYQMNYGNNLIRSKWKRGKYSDPKHVLELPDKLLCPMSADTWGEIFQMELER